MHGRAHRPARQGAAPSHALSDIKLLIRERVNLPDLAPRLGIEKKGCGWLCPFHDDKNPSFGLRDDHFCSFACGAKGDCFELVARLRGCSFMEAVAELCGIYGVAFPFVSPHRGGRTPPPPSRVVANPNDPKAGPDLDPERRTSILTEFARSVAIGPNAAEDHPVLSFLSRRHITRSVARDLGLGYVGDYRGTQQALTGRFPLPELQAAGLFNGRGNLRLYRHRLVMPFALGGRVHGLQARNLGWRSKDDGPKELLLGSPRVPFHCDVLAEDIDRVFLTEGVIDSLSLGELGLPSVGVPGAMGFKPEWVPLFEKVPAVVVAFDNDEAGRKGTRKVVDAFAARGRTGIQTVEWPEEVNDANEYLKLK